MVKPVKVSAAATKAAAIPTKRILSYAAKVEAIPGEFLEKEAGAFKLNGTVHLLLQLGVDFFILCARCNNKFEQGSFVPRMTGQKNCTQKNPDRSSPDHDS
eukprot:scaffold12487_cov37-Cyclotella_meneghiniana.AAC.3